MWFFRYIDSMPDFSSIQQHPDVEEIIDKLLNGTDPKSISDSLKLRYTEDSESHLLISIKLLKEFQESEYLNYYNQAKQDLSKIKNKGTINKKLALSIQNNKTYQERLNEAIDEEINILKEYKALKLLLFSRIEQVFDKIQEDTAVINSKNDYVLTKYTEQFMSLIEKIDKVINNRPDQVIQHNYVVQYIEQYQSILQQAIIETLREIDSEASNLFMEKIAEKMSSLKVPELNPPNENKILQEVQTLSAKLITNGTIV